LLTSSFRHVENHTDGGSYDLIVGFIRRHWHRPRA
jgi:hypothetical protein